MATVTVPQGSPEKWEAMRTLNRAGHVVKEVVRVYSPGDPEAACDEGGTPRPTVLFIDGKGRALSALMYEQGVVDIKLGW